jgi:hypothetical protein
MLVQSPLELQRPFQAKPPPLLLLLLLQARRRPR